MKFFTKKKRSDGVEIAHYHGKGSCNTSNSHTTTGICENIIEVSGDTVKEIHKKGSSVLTIDKTYTDYGPALGISFNITLPYDEFTVFEMPVSCLKCPVGFQKDVKCGRNVPFKEEDYTRRPETCKLKESNNEELKRLMGTAIFTNLFKHGL